jgi:hypothetical protein
MGPSKMSEQFFYIHLKFIPKIVTLTVTILRQREVVVEVSKRLIHGPPTDSNRDRETGIIGHGKRECQWVDSRPDRLYEDLPATSRQT